MAYKIAYQATRKGGSEYVGYIRMTGKSVEDARRVAMAYLFSRKWLEPGAGIYIVGTALA